MCYRKSLADGTGCVPQINLEIVIYQCTIISQSADISVSLQGVPRVDTIRKSSCESIQLKMHYKIVWVIRLHNKSSVSIKTYNDLRKVVRSDKDIDEIIDSIERPFQT